MTKPSSLLGRQAGFSLLEALTALLVTAFGMLTIAGFHVALSQNADVAKQRSEAVRLAQQKVEELRAYEQVASDAATGGTKFDYTDEVVSGSDTVSPSSDSPYTTNTSYARSWNVTGTGTTPQKWVRVAVSWTDRSNTLQTVNLQTVIARADPIAIGTLAVGPGGMKTRSPKNRNIDIPYPAVGLTGEMSGFLPPGGDKFFVFNDLTGDVLGYCNGALSEGGTAYFAGVSKNCDAYDLKPYLLTGYIRFVDVNGGLSVSDLINPKDETKPLSVAVDLTVGGSPAPLCYAARQQVVSAGTGNQLTPQIVTGLSRTGNVVTITTQNGHGLLAGHVVSISSPEHPNFNGVFTVLSNPPPTTMTFSYSQAGSTGSFSLSAGTSKSKATKVQQVTIEESATVPPGYDTVVSKFVGYTCVVFPVDHDTSTSTPNRWTGGFRIVPSGWTIGTGNDAFKVCRYTGDYVPDSKVSNIEHPLKYWGVIGTLDNQNYVVIKGNQNCPTDTAADALAGKYTNVNTKEHQPSGVLSSGGGFASEEPTAPPDGKLPMF